MAARSQSGRQHQRRITTPGSKARYKRFSANKKARTKTRDVHTAVGLVRPCSSLVSPTFIAMKQCLVKPAAPNSAMPFQLRRPPPRQVHRRAARSCVPLHIGADTGRLRAGKPCTARGMLPNLGFQEHTEHFSTEHAKLLATTRVSRPKHQRAAALRRLFPDSGVRWSGGGLVQRTARPCPAPTRRPSGPPDER